MIGCIASADRCDRLEPDNNGAPKEQQFLFRKQLPADKRRLFTQIISTQFRDLLRRSVWTPRRITLKARRTAPPRQTAAFFTGD
jgi:hypothetical protein